MCTRFHCSKHSLLIEQVVCPCGSGHLWSSVTSLLLFHFIWENRMIMKSCGCRICVNWFWKNKDVPWKNIGRSWKNTLKKENFQFFTFMEWLMVCSLKSFKVLKWYNLDFSFVAGEVTVANSKYAKPLNLN